MDKEKLRLLAKDLRKEVPRSPREMLGGYVIAARAVDKCRAFLLGMNGEYSYWPCSLSSQLYAFTGLGPEAVKQFVETGATDLEFGDWLISQSKVKDRMEIIRWNNKMRARSGFATSTIMRRRTWRPISRKMFRNITPFMSGLMCMI